MISLIHTTFRCRDCTGPHARTYCTLPYATATASYRCSPTACYSYCALSPSTPILSGLWF